MPEYLVAICHCTPEKEDKIRRLAALYRVVCAFFWMDIKPVWEEAAVGDRLSDPDAQCGKIAAAMRAEQLLATGLTPEEAKEKVMAEFPQAFSAAQTAA